MLPDMTFFHKTKDAHESVDTLLVSYRENKISSAQFLKERHELVS